MKSANELDHSHGAYTVLHNSFGDVYRQIYGRNLWKRIGNMEAYRYPLIFLIRHNFFVVKL